jgi:hypothetical protein
MIIELKNYFQLGTPLFAKNYFFTHFNDYVATGAGGKKEGER